MVWILAAVSEIANPPTILLSAAASATNTPVPTVTVPLVAVIDVMWLASAARAARLVWILAAVSEIANPPTILLSAAASATNTPVPTVTVPLVAVIDVIWLTSAVRAARLVWILAAVSEIANPPTISLSAAASATNTPVPTVTVPLVAVIDVMRLASAARAARLVWILAAVSEIANPPTISFSAAASATKTAVPTATVPPVAVIDVMWLASAARAVRLAWTLAAVSEIANPPAMLFSDDSFAMKYATDTGDGVDDVKLNPSASNCSRSSGVSV